MAAMSTPAPTDTAYQPRRHARSEFVPVRDQLYHVRVWEADAAPGAHLAAPLPPLFMVHGWMDVAASFQFVVDAMAGQRTIVAPDWRGFGLTRPLAQPEGTRPLADHYVFADYLGDLDALMDHYMARYGTGAPTAQADLVGHSMGGNVAMMYGGVRPEHIRRLVNLEGFGMPNTAPAQAPTRYARWLDEIKALRTGALGLRGYDSLQGVAQRLMKTNRRLDPARALWLAEHWSARNAQDQWEILGDPAHKVTSAQLYRWEEVQAVYQRIAAPVLAVEASDDSLHQWFKGSYTLADYHERLKQVPQVRIAQVNDAGHMLHHDQPEALARLIEEFLAG
jgi:pimeloyl-ACP methyl ester carboxylesterase